MAEKLDFQTALERFKSDPIYQHRQTLGELYDWLFAAWKDCGHLHRYESKDVLDRMTYELQEYIKLKPVLFDDHLERRFPEIDAVTGSLVPLIEKYGRGKLVSEVMKEIGE